MRRRPGAAETAAFGAPAALSRVIRSIPRDAKGRRGHPSVVEQLREVVDCDQKCDQGPFVPQRLRVLAAKPARRDLETLTAFIETGQLIPVIERTYALADTAKALSHLAEQHARSKLVIAVPAPPPPPAARQMNDA